MARRRAHPPLGPIVVEPVTACRSEVSATLARYGNEAGQFHVLGPDPWQVLWNEDRSGFVAFLEARRCLFAWRSPVAAPGDEHDLLVRLRRHGRDRRKPVVGVLVNDATCRAGVQLGMTPVWLGSETFHDLPDWTIQGGRRQKLRWARSHAAKLGFTWREARPLADRADWLALERVEQQWKDARKQRHTDSFQRTSFSELAEMRRYFVCERPESPHDVVAFVACTPVNADGWYLQDVVRLDDAPRGALEGAITAALDALRDDDYKFVTNGPIALWRPDGEAPDPHALGPVGRRVVHFFDGQYRFRGLAQFRTKLDPDRVEPLYILLPRRLVTPGMAMSLTRVLTKRISP